MNKSPQFPDTPISRECQKYAHALGAYVDGELDAAKLLEIEGHVTQCETCSERIALDRALRGTVKKVVRLEASQDEGQKSAMRARMLAAMNGERARGEARKAEEREERVIASLPAVANGTSGDGKIFGWRTMVPLSSAAALAIVWGSIAHAPSRDVSTNVRAAGLANDPLAGFVDMHRHTWPMERTDAMGVRGLEQYVGVPVRPPLFDKKNAHLVGGRLMPVLDQRAALLEYRIGDGDGARRVSVFIYDPRKIQVGDSDMLQPRAVGTAQVRVGRSNGYSVAVTQNRGIGYTLASDLDEGPSAELAAIADKD
jgi:anti-sigma factor RsiW